MHEYAMSHRGTLQERTTYSWEIGEVPAVISIRAIVLNGKHWEIAGTKATFDIATGFSFITVMLKHGDDEMELQTMTRVPDSALELLALINPCEERASGND